MGELNSGTAMIVATSFAIQQFVELFDTLVLRTDESRNNQSRLPILKSISFVLGLLAAFVCKDCMAVTDLISNDALRTLVMAFGLAAGTEGANSLLKFAQYTKDNQRAVAASARDAASGQFALHSRIQSKTL